MNLKTLRKNYDALSFRERYSIYQNALLRNDDSELNAIILASPKLTYKQVDFAHFDELIMTLNLANLIQRLDYSARFDLFLNHKNRESERIIDCLFLTGYLYVIETDAWKAVGAEFGFDVEGFRKKMSESCLAIRLMNLNDEMMRKISFSKEGIEKFAEEKIDFSEIITLESEIKKYRDILIDAEKNAT